MHCAVLALTAIAPHQESAIQHLQSRAHAASVLYWLGRSPSARSRNCVGSAARLVFGLRLLSRIKNGYSPRQYRTAVSTSVIFALVNTPTGSVVNRLGSRERIWKQRNTVSNGNPLGRSQILCRWWTALTEYLGLRPFEQAEQQDWMM